MSADAPGPTAHSTRLLEAARSGDERAFEELIEPRRAELHAHCYRMLGSPYDADDALQEALLRAWRGLGGFERGRSLRPWLYRIATNVCLDAIKKRPKRVLPIDHGPPAGEGEGPGEPIVELIWLEPYPDERLGHDAGLASPEARYEQREAVELAFVAALQHLPPSQRAVLILRDVLGFSAREVAESLETTVASVNSSVQRARRTVEERLPERSQQETLAELGDDRLRRVVRNYIAAWESRDIDAMVAMLVADATFAMAAAPALVPRPRGGHRLPGNDREAGPAPRAYARERPAGNRLVSARPGERAIPAGLARGARPRGRPRPRDHGVHGPHVRGERAWLAARPLPALRASGRAVSLGLRFRSPVRTLRPLSPFAWGVNRADSL